MKSPPKTILLVDDDGSVREVIKMALEAWGYGVWVAEDGEEALSIIRIRGPKVVLSDVIMPKLDGLSLLRWLKRWNPSIAVILFTAYPSLAVAVSAMKEGAADVLTKPIDFRRLRRELERLLGGDHDPKDNVSLPSSKPAISASPARKPLPLKEARPMSAK
jgi:DNA-binding NtrC family response regulator